MWLFQKLINIFFLQKGIRQPVFNNRIVISENISRACFNQLATKKKINSRSIFKEQDAAKVNREKNKEKVSIGWLVTQEDGVSTNIEKEGCACSLECRYPWNYNQLYEGYRSRIIHLTDKRNALVVSERAAGVNRVPTISVQTFNPQSQRYFRFNELMFLIFSYYEWYSAWQMKRLVISKQESMRYVARKERRSTKRGDICVH